MTLFAKGEDGYHSYRIPAVITSGQGTVLAFCEARKESVHDTGDIDLVLKRSFDGGETWGPLQLVFDNGEHTVGNPCPLLDRTTGRIWLPVTCNDGRNTIPQNKTDTGFGTREVFILYSDDDGQTWSAPQNITPQVKQPNWTWYATGPGNGIQLRDGRLVIPCNHRLAGDSSPDPDSYAHVVYSDDDGQTWQIGGSIEPKTNECQVVELDNGDLLLNARSHHGRNRRFVARSHDRGQTWEPGDFDETLLDPTCQGSIIRVEGEAGCRE